MTTRQNKIHKYNLHNRSLHNTKQIIKNNTTHQNENKVKLGSLSSASVYADTLPVPTSDNNDRNGWLHSKSVADTSKLNYYFYGSSGSSHPFTLNDLKSLYVKCSIDNYTGTSSVPFFVVYTVPTGVADSGAWFHSKISYSIRLLEEKIISGEHITLYALDKPNLHNDNREIGLNYKIETGEALGTEQILALSIQTDSGSPINTNTLITKTGYNMNNEIQMNLDYVI
ncbi:MAG: hypothetical protein H8E55_66325 [Pelagibacterales bacterium]|nr:hypothetical protein [Pelagibacterales bacterium]